jgi:epsilon-lactone hydrolase
MSSESPSELFTTIVDSIPADFNSPEDDYLTVREKMAPLHGGALADTTVCEDAGLGDQASTWVTAAEVDDRGWHALFCHGGGFVSVRMPEYLFWGEWVSRNLNTKTLVPDYRLAPEHPYPAALEDCLSAWRAMLDAGIDPATVIFTGDSCGGGLALCAMIKARDEGLPLPAGFVGFTAWYDLTLPGESGINPGGKDPFITPGWYHNRVRDYLGQADLDAAYTSATRSDCSGLPPLLLQTGAIDLTRDSAIEMARVASAANVQVELQLCQHMVHGFQGLAGVPEADAAWQSARQFVEKILNN